MKALVFILAALFFTACGSEEPVISELAEIGSGQTGGAPARLGDLDRVPYKSANCSAIVSGAEEPRQLIVSGRCYRYSRVDFVMQCPNTARSCAQAYANGGRAEASISENFAQITIMAYGKNGDREFGESFLVEKSN